MNKTPELGDIVQLNSSGPDDPKMTIVWTDNVGRVEVAWIDMFGGYHRIEISPKALKH